MKNKKYWVLVIMLGICASVIWAANKTDSQTYPQVTFTVDQRDTLKGLQGVKVSIEYPKPKEEKYGLTTQPLQTDVELRLRQNGIRVLSDQERLSTPGMPYLYVYVNTVVNENLGLATYNISLDLYQNVFLTRDITKSCFASTWHCGGVGNVSLGQIETIREKVKGNVDEFINDYLAANPPQPVKRGEDKEQNR